MKFNYVIAIVRPDAVESLKVRLRSLGVGGLTLTKVKGYGEYKNFYTADWLSDHTRVEIFVEHSKVDALVDALVEVTDSDIPGAGVVAVMPVDRFLHLRTGTETLPEAAAQTSV
jgi:nitrogen regulatory protein P-II 1